MFQSQSSPIDEFVKKADKLLQEEKANPALLDAMGQSLNIVWQDLLQLFQQRREVLDANANFHEKMGACIGTMSALEVACTDTMVPNSIEPIQDYLIKFKQLRIEMLAAVMVALKEGNGLLTKLRELATCGSLESRPDNIKIEIKKALTQVENWLEELHNRRNYLEQAWKFRKIQLEQCLALSILNRDIADLETTLRNYKSAIDTVTIQFESESDVTHLLSIFANFKNDAVNLRDKAVRITRSTEKISSLGGFDGNEASAKAYAFLGECTEHLEHVDNKENLFIEIKEFFTKGEKCLSILEKLEIEMSTANELSSPKEIIKLQSRTIAELANITDEPLALGHKVINRLGPSSPETKPIERIVVEIENRKTYLNSICLKNNDQLLKISETLNAFLERHNNLLAWLVSVNKAFLPSNNSIGKNRDESQAFLRIHRELLTDLEVINMSKSNGRTLFIS